MVSFNSAFLKFKNSTGNFRIIFIAFCLLPVVANAQIINSSFELNDSTPSLAGWNYNCSADTFFDAAPDGGKWSMRVIHDTAYECSPSFVWQLLHEMESGGIYERSFCFKKDSGFATPINFAIMTIVNGLPDEPVSILLTSNTYDDWRCFSWVDTLQFVPTDTICYAINIGVQSGIMPGYTLFDKLNLVKIGNITSVPTPAGGIGKFYTRYDALSNELTATLRDFEMGDALLTIINATGKEVVNKHFMIYTPDEMNISVPVKNFIPGIYFVALYYNNSVVSRKVVIGNR